MESKVIRKYFIGGNWKSNNTYQFSKDLIQNVINKIEYSTDLVEVLVAPISLHVPWVAENAAKKILVGTQNTSLTGYGAFTGEISAEAVKDLGLSWTILGHSERRTLYGETDEVVAKKTRKALDVGLNVVFCFGETLPEREGAKTLEVVQRQLAAAKAVLKAEDWAKIVLAYEPVWAIGTGKVATPDQAQEVHGAVRDWVRKEVSGDVATAVRIIYGGSVSEKNCGDLIKLHDVDGFLVGGASLKPEFQKIVEVANAHKKINP